MTNLLSKRKDYTETSTIGSLYNGDLFLSFVLEDTVRDPGVKVPGKTAIPAGRYQVVIDFSTRFKRMMPHLLNVPMFDGIRIHAGNVAADTEGCLLLGQTKGKDFVGRSKSAFEEFFPKLGEWLLDGEVWITIVNKEIKEV